MATTRKIPTELLEQLRRDREKIATELPDLIERGRLLEESANGFRSILMRRSPKHRLLAPQGL